MFDESAFVDAVLKDSQRRFALSNKSIAIIVLKFGSSP
jgi:hypothetical protein